MNMDEFYENKRRTTALRLAIVEKNNIPSKPIVSAADEADERKIKGNIANLIREIPVDFHFPKEFTDAESDHAMRPYTFSDSPLGIAMKFGDNETATLIINKQGVKPDNFVIGNKVPSLEYAINYANEEMAALIFERISAKMQEKYKADFIAAFGEERFTSSIQSEPPKLPKIQNKRGKD